jgi:hypothetical protein
VLDPVLLVYSGFIGGVDYDYAWDIAVDSEGASYVVGTTKSKENSFPETVGPDLTFNGDYDAFVAKINPQGTDLEYCGYIGGSLSETGDGIAVDESGCAYVVITTNSSEFDLPVKVGPDLTFNGFYDVLVAKVNPAGDDLVYCGFIGGSENADTGRDICVDQFGCAYVTGNTNCTEATFPVKIGPDLTHNGKQDGFVARINAAGTALDYCGYVGGNWSDVAHGIAVDEQGCVYIAGFSNSDESTFPRINGPDLTFNGRDDAFVGKVRADGSGLIYCGYIGGGEDDYAMDVAVDGAGCAYVTGWTDSGELRFPETVGPDLTYNGDDDAFVAKVNAQGNGLIYCGYLGGERNEKGYDIAVDISGFAYVAGRTWSDEDTFPVILGPDLTYNGGTFDAYVAKIDKDGSGLIYCGYVGGDEYDAAYGCAVDQAGAIYITGITTSTQATFPTARGPDLTANGDEEAFVVKIALALAADAYTLSEQGGTIEFYLTSGDDHASRAYLLAGGYSGTEPGFALPGGLATLPVNFDEFTYHVLFPLLNSTIFSNFLGALDEYGQAQAQLNAPALPPGYVGLELYFAFCLNNPFDFASNPVEIEIIP